jgi:hypothetical protein
MGRTRARACPCPKHPDGPEGKVTKKTCCGLPLCSAENRPAGRPCKAAKNEPAAVVRQKAAPNSASVLGRGGRDDDNFEAPPAPRPLANPSPIEVSPALSDETIIIESEDDEVDFPVYNNPAIELSGVGSASAAPARSSKVPYVSQIAAHTSTELEEARQRWVTARADKRGGKFAQVSMAGASADERKLLQQLKTARRMYFDMSHSATGHVATGGDYKWFTDNMLIQLVRCARENGEGAPAFHSTLERCFMWGPKKARSRPLTTVFEIHRSEFQQGLFAKVLFSGNGLGVATEE